MKSLLAKPIRAAALLLLLSGAAQAETYPSHPVRFIVPFAPAGPTDVFARLMAQKLSAKLGQQFYVENQAGAGGNLAMGSGAHAAPDGYSVLFVSTSFTVNPSLFSKVPYDPYKDFAAVTLAAVSPNILTVHPSIPAQSVKELIAFLKANPGKLNMASGGIGTSPHLCGELFQILTGTKMTHVPYRANFMPDLLSGQVQISFDPPAQALPLIRDGRLRAYGVTTAYRIKALPDVPAIGEVVKGYDAIGWYGLGAPAKTPPEIIRKLNEAMTAAVTDPKVKEHFDKLGVEPMPLSPEGFKQHIATEVAKWSKVIETQGIKIS